MIRINCFSRFGTAVRKLFSAKNMTEGAPWKRIMEFAVPMLLGNLAQQLYNTADTVIVGIYVGDNALSAIATVLIMVIGPLVSMPFLRMLGTPDSIIYWCAEYLNIYFIGIVGFFFYNMLSGILRGLGDSVSALGFLIIAALLNVGLDLIFVRRMGVAGVALATVLAQGISAVLCFIKLRRMGNLFDLNIHTLKLIPTMSTQILKLGVPSGVTQAIMAMAGMVVMNLTNAMGELVIACNVIVMRVDGFAMMPNMTFGQTMSVYTGQNVGAGKLDRVKQGTKQGGLMALSFAVTITIILLFFGKYLFAIFTDTVELIDLANRMIRVLAVGYIGICVSQVLGGVMRGAGDTLSPMWISMISIILIRIPVAYGLAYLTRSEAFPHGEPIALFASLLISWVSGAIISAIVFARGKWKKKALAASEG